jgi:hypothetical protein
MKRVVGNLETLSTVEMGSGGLERTRKRGNRASGEVRGRGRMADNLKRTTGLCEDPNGLSEVLEEAKEQLTDVVAELTASLDFIGGWSPV